MADGKPASATIFYLPDQYRPFPLLIAGEVFLFLVIRRNPLPPNSPGTPPQFRPALDGSFYFKKTHVIDPTKRISAGRAVLLATAWSDRRRAGRRLEPGS